MPDQKLHDHIQDLLNDALRHSAFGLSLGYESPRSGRNILTAGWADTEQTTPMSRDSLFQVGSLTKMYTAVCIHQLIKSGRLDLDAPVKELIEEFPAGMDVRVRHLLTHTSGIGNASRLLDPINHPVDFELDFAQRMFLTQVARPAFPPGEGWEYNNAGYWTLGEIISRVSGSSFRDYLQSHVLDPLRLHDTFVGSAYSFPLERMARSLHTDVNEKEIETTAHLCLAESDAAGDLVSGVDDVLTWLRALHNADDSLGVSLTELEAQEVSCRGDRYTNALGYASGVQHFQVGGRTYWGHGGAMCGYLSLGIIDPDSGLGICLLSNRHTRAGPDWVALQGVGFALVTTIACVLHSHDI